MYGSYATIEDTPTLSFERRLSHPVARVWQTITEPGELEHWFPARVEADLRVGGKITFTFGHALPAVPGEVTELDPPRLFAFRWGEDHLRFELEPLDRDEGCTLRLTVQLGTREKAARDAAGWHVCLDRLEQRLGGEGGNGEWRGYYDEYQRRGLPAGAPIPGE